MKDADNKNNKNIGLEKLDPYGRKMFDEFKKNAEKRGIELNISENGEELIFKFPKTGTEHRVPKEIMYIKIEIETF